MKNIHLIPTSQPSRFSLNSSGKYHLKNQTYTNSLNFTNQNIYITNNEEIKFNDYITDGYKVWKWQDNSSLLGRKKVILTTDQYLDGVQAIDDEFLEWFFKNPNCEFIEVESLNIGDGKLGYVICKPQEEPKQKEILEEVAKKAYLSRLADYLPVDFEDGVKLGAKWQQEQDKNKFSIDDLKEAFAMGRTNATIKDFNTKFKNK